MKRKRQQPTSLRCSQREELAVGVMSNMNMRAYKILRWMAWCITVGLILAACLPQNTSSSVAHPNITPTSDSDHPFAAASNNSEQKDWSGEIYFLLSTPSPPFTYHCIRLPIDCLLNSTCQSPDILRGFPTNYTPFAPLSWAPDGERALVLNPNGSQLLVFDPQKGTFHTLIDDIAMTTGRIMWSPNGQWVAVSVQDAEPYKSHVVLIDPDNGTKHALEGFESQMQLPVGWLNERELLVLVEKYRPIREGDFLKQEVSEAKMYKVNVWNNRWVELGQDKNWIGSTPVLSPDKSELAFTTDGKKHLLVVMRLDGMKENILGAYGIQPVWSPDGKEIATYRRISEDQIEVYVVHSDGTFPRVVFHGEGAFANVVWLPDSKRLLILDTSDVRETTSLFVVDVTGGKPRPLSVPGLDADSSRISWLSVRPPTKP